MIARALSTAALVAALSAGAWAQTPAPAPVQSEAVAVQPAAPPVLSKAEQAAVESRIKALQSELGITERQMPLWQAFAQTMRDNAAATEALFQRRASTAATMSAVDNMRSYAEIARAYADDTDHLATDFASLYASLSDLQQRAADTLFRQQMAQAAQPKRP